MVQAFGGHYLHFANDGSSSAIGGAVAGLTSFLGMWADPVNGHVISASNSGLVDIDPLAGTFRVINATLFPDGVSVSPDGTTAYVENGGTIQSYSIATGALIQTYFTGHSPDGTGVITGGIFNGDVVVNNNDGTVGLLDPITSVYTLIATGGTRGDFVSPDLNNGTLFLSQNEQVARLTCGADCSFVPPPPGIPEPGTLVLLGLGIAGLAFSRRNKQ